ncbi:MAG TPA: aldehyde dehydrogenase family protein [Acidobacteriota bacterium]
MHDPGSDRDLESIREARELGRAAVAAQRRLESFSQEQIDAIVEAMAAAGLAHSERLAEIAHRETGFGNVPDKVRKNNFVLQDVVAAMRGMRTVGVLREDREHGVREIAEPVGVVAGIIPSTNPTSTAMFKCLIALKARCGIVLSPHPSARECIRASADVLATAAEEAGAPAGIIACMSNVTMQGTQELMNGRETDLILATGGIALVKAAYSAGKPAYGVGPGNVPAYIERTADVAKAVRDVIAGTTFDNGTLCSSEQAIVCDRAIEREVRDQVRAQGGHFLSPEECRRLGALLITDKLLVNPDFVGRPAAAIAAAAGLEVPAGVRVLVCPIDGVGKQYPLSHEKLSPVLAFYVVEDWQEGCARCTELLRFGGMGHTLAIHSRNDDVVLEFGLRKPAHRVLVNTVAALGAVGLTTHLFPSMTLGCGSWGNNITSDNVGPQHLLNVKRLAYETREYVPSTAGATAAGGAAASSSGTRADGRADLSATIVRRGTTTPPSGPTGGRHQAADGLEARIAAFLARRGVLRDDPAPPPAAGRASLVSVRDEPSGASPETASERRRERARTPPSALAACSSGPAGGADARSQAGAGGEPAEFVAEADVREAAEKGEKILLGPCTILTPLARELGEARGVFRRR